MVSRVVFVCEEDKAMFELVKGKYNLYYRCMKYDRENRQDNENVCMNRLSLKDAYMMYSILEDLENKGRLTAGASGREKWIDYKIISADDELIFVTIYNHNYLKGV